MIKDASEGLRRTASRSKAPALSVLLPVHNASTTLPAALESILAQDFEDFEVLVIDDNSSDFSRRIAEDLVRNDKRMRVIAATGNGLVQALNLGLSEAEGFLVARMDADDVARRDRFRLQYDLITRNGNIAAVGSFAREIDEAGRVTGRIRLPEDPIAIRIHLRLRGNALAHSSVMMRKDIVIGSGGYREAFKHAEDYDLWLRLSERHDLYNIPEFLLDYRRVSKGVSASNVEQQCLSSIGARQAYEIRTQGRPDPADGALPIGRDTLIEWGVTPKLLNEMMQDWIGSTLSTAARSGVTIDIEGLLELAERYEGAVGPKRTTRWRLLYVLEDFSKSHRTLARKAHDLLGRQSAIARTSRVLLVRLLLARKKHLR